MIFALTLLSVASFVPIAVGWTGAIHSEIVWRVYSRATPNARRFIKHHLGSDLWDIGKAATWADSEDAKTRYPHSEDYHFSHTPYRNCGKFELNRDCGFGESGRCLVTGIAHMVMRSVDPTIRFQERQDALKFVIHLIADIHQPLHTGFSEDMGGVMLNVVSRPEMSLHQIWDFALMGEIIESEAAVPIIKLPDRLFNKSAIIEYASALATESSTVYTCRQAYMTDDGLYIVSGQSLNQQYMDSRLRIAQQRISHASSRLASLLDVMATTFFEQKTAIRAERVKAQAPVAFSITMPQNYYTALDADFLPDEIVDICQDSLELQRSRRPGLPPGRKKLRHEMSEMEYLEQAMAEAAEQRAAMRMMSKMAFEPNPSVQGVELSSIVLIRRGTDYFITKKEFVMADPSYMPVTIVMYSIRTLINKRLGYSKLGIDAAVFGTQQISPEDFNRIFVYLKYGEDVPEEVVLRLSEQADKRARAPTPASAAAVARGWREDDLATMGGIYGRRVERGIIATDPRPIESDELSKRWFDEYTKQINARIQQGKSVYGSVDKMHDYDFYSKFRSVVVYNSENLQGYFLKESLLDASITHRRLNLFLVRNTGQVGHAEFFMVVDTQIFDGLITRRIQEGMTRVDHTRAIHSHPVTASAPTLAAEMTDLVRVLNRRPGRRTRIIQDLIQYPSIHGKNLVKVIEYEIRKPDS